MRGIIRYRPAMQKILRLAEMADKELRGKEATLIEPGKYQGRLGIIDGVTADHRYGLTALFYVYRFGTKERLNGHAESRSYRPLDSLELVKE